jgi:hypothetical protein
LERNKASRGKIEKERKKVRKGIDKGVRRWYSIKVVAKVTARKQESLVEKN